jgi:hypothetical protein
MQEASPIDLVDVIKTQLAKSATWSGLLGWLLSKVMAVFVKISLFLDCVVQHPNISTLLYWTQDLMSNMAITVGWVNVQWIKSWVLKIGKRLNRSSKPQSGHFLCFPLSCHYFSIVEQMFITNIHAFATHKNQNAITFSTKKHSHMWLHEDLIMFPKKSTSPHLCVCQLVNKNCFENKFVNTIAIKYKISHKY